VASWLGRRLGALMDHGCDDPKMTRPFTPAVFSALVHSAHTPGRLGEPSPQVRTYKRTGIMKRGRIEQGLAWLGFLFACSHWLGAPADNGNFYGASNSCIVIRTALNGLRAAMRGLHA
jgi:hypothetical protein